MNGGSHTLSQPWVGLRFNLANICRAIFAFASFRFTSFCMICTCEDIFAFASQVDDIVKIYSHSLRKMHIIANDANIFAKNGKITSIS